MQYDSKIAEAAHCLALAGLADQTVGRLVDDGQDYAFGPQWQALVRVARHRLYRCTATDKMLTWSDRLSKHLRPGHEALVWVVEENGVMITHDAVDMDSKGHAEKVVSMKESFAEVTQHYLQEGETDAAGTSGGS